MTGDQEIYDVFIIGTGMAGMAAAVFAAARGLSTAVCGSVGGIDFTSGSLDLLAVYPVAEGRVWTDPWAALELLIREEPWHPYALVGARRVRAAMDEFCAALEAMGLPYEGYGERNVSMLTPAGTLKTTYRVPRGMWPGVQAVETKAPTLLVSFKGLKGFSSRQIQEVRQADWPGLRSVLLPFPGHSGELYAEHLAAALSEPDIRQALASTVARELDGEAYVGFPASLGLYDAADVQAHLEAMLGAKVFEIPTLPPTLAGARLRAAFELNLPRRGVAVFSQKLAVMGRALDTGLLTFRIQGLGLGGWGESGAQPSEHGAWEPDDANQGLRITARTAIHAGGRFFGKGLQANRETIREPLLGLPVAQPPDRGHWHRETFFHPQGHPVNRAGLLTDRLLRPLGSLSGAQEPAFPNLFAAGSILAGQDWVRERCGAGLAIATAYAAVEGALERLR